MPYLIQGLPVEVEGRIVQFLSPNERINKLRLLSRTIEEKFYWDFVFPEIDCELEFIEGTLKSHGTMIPVPWDQCGLSIGSSSSEMNNSGVEDVASLGPDFRLAEKLLPPVRFFILETLPLDQEESMVRRFKIALNSCSDFFKKGDGRRMTGGEEGNPPLGDVSSSSSRYQFIVEAFLTPLLKQYTVVLFRRVGPLHNFLLELREREEQFYKRSDRGSVDSAPSRPSSSLYEMPRKCSPAHAPSLQLGGSEKGRLSGGYGGGVMEQKEIGPKAPPWKEWPDRSFSLTSHLYLPCVNLTHRHITPPLARQETGRELPQELVSSLLSRNSHLFIRFLDEALPRSDSSGGSVAQLNALAKEGALPEGYEFPGFLVFGTNSAVAGVTVELSSQFCKIFPRMCITSCKGKVVLNANNKSLIKDLVATDQYRPTPWKGAMAQYVECGPNWQDECDRFSGIRLGQLSRYGRPNRPLLDTACFGSGLKILELVDLKVAEFGGFQGAGLFQLERVLVRDLPELQIIGSKFCSCCPKLHLTEFFNLPKLFKIKGHGFLYKASPNLVFRSNVAPFLGPYDGIKQMNTKVVLAWRLPPVLAPGFFHSSTAMVVPKGKYDRWVNLRPFWKTWEADLERKWRYMGGRKNPEQWKKFAALTYSSENGNGDQAHE